MLQHSQRLSAWAEQPQLGKPCDQRQVARAAETASGCRQPDAGHLFNLPKHFSAWRVRNYQAPLWRNPSSTAQHQWFLASSSGRHSALLRPASPCCGGLNTSWHATACIAEREASHSRHEEQLSLRRAIALLCLAQRGLTLRSRRGPTASHQPRATGTVYIFGGPGLASRRWPRLNSNVRPRKTSPTVL